MRKVFCYRADFKIRTKEDAKRFLHMVNDPDFGRYDGELYWTDGETDFCLNATAARVSTRPATERGNIFSPYFCDNDEHEAVNTIYMTRKCINARWFNED